MPDNNVYLIYLIDMTDFVVINEVDGQKFTTLFPARSTLAERSLGAQAESALIAMRP
jgi:hypothetical protein